MDPEIASLHVLEKNFVWHPILRATMVELVGAFSVFVFG